MDIDARQTLLRQMEERRKEIQKGISGIGFRYAVFAVVVLGSQLLLGGMLPKLFPDMIRKDPTILSLLLIVLSMDVLGLPLIYFLCRKVPAQQPERNPIRFGEWMLGLLYITGLMAVGTLVGTVLNLIACLPLYFAPSSGGESGTSLLDLMMYSKPLLRILVVGVLAPVIEELIFRKILIDRLLPYGKLTAVIASGMMFGLFHGNFSQCFYAGLLGFFLAYIYLKTGDIRYTVAYHMVVNLTSSCITVPLLTKYLEQLEKAGLQNIRGGSMGAFAEIFPILVIMMLWLGILFVMAITGFILLILHRRKFRLPEEGNVPKGKNAWKVYFKNPGIWAFQIICLMLFFYQYLGPLLF